MLRRLLLPTLFLAATATAVAADEQAVIVDDGLNHVGEILVVIGPPAQSTFPSCDLSWAAQHAVFIRPGSETNATLTDVGFPGDENPGSRFEVIDQTLCDVGRLHLLLRRLVPANSQPLLFATGGGLATDQIGVITGPQDESGVADVVFTTAEGKPARTTLLTDTWLQPADRLVDLVELDHDPETGVSIYGAYLEY